jgi:hypothetical protein
LRTTKDSGRGAAERLEFADELPEKIEHGGILRVRQVDDREIDAEVGESGEPRGDPAQVAVVAEPAGGRLHDRVVRPPGVLAVLAEHAELVPQVNHLEHVAGVGVPGDQPERLLLARPADEDGRPAAGIWKKWSIGQMLWIPASSARSRASARVGSIAAEPPGQLKIIGCSPSFIPLTLAG